MALALKTTPAVFGREFFDRFFSAEEIDWRRTGIKSLLMHNKSLPAYSQVCLTFESKLSLFV